MFLQIFQTAVATLLNRVALAAGIALCPACAPSDDLTGGPPGTTPGGPVQAVNLPAGGRALLFVGQDADATLAYQADTGLTPGGIVAYTALPGLAGLTADSDLGGTGRQNLQQLVGRFPGASIAVGLYLVGQLDAINAGAQDAAIDRLLATLAGFGRRVWLRIGYEFDQPANGYDPAAYVAAFRRIVTRMRALAPTTMASVWQTSAHCGSAGGDFARWYPGDDAVDWIGLSYFQQGMCAQLPVFDVLYFARGKGKPVMVAESTPQGYDIAGHTFSLDGKSFAARNAGQIWSEWYAPYFQLLTDERDVIRAVSYIDADWNAHLAWSSGQNGYWGDSRVQADADVLARWKTAIAGDLFVQP